MGFDSKKVAKEFIKNKNRHYNKNKRVYKSRRGQCNVRGVYQCVICDQWHLTSQTKKQTRQYNK
jgi:hypothetical protein